MLDNYIKFDLNPEIKFDTFYLEKSIDEELTKLKELYYQNDKAKKYSEARFTYTLTNNWYKYFRYIDDQEKLKYLFNICLEKERKLKNSIQNLKVYHQYYMCNYIIEKILNIELTKYNTNDLKDKLKVNYIKNTLLSTKFNFNLIINSLKNLNNIVEEKINNAKNLNNLNEIKKEIKVFIERDIPLLITKYQEREQDRYIAITNYIYQKQKVYDEYLVEYSKIKTDMINLKKTSIIKKKCKNIKIKKMLYY